MDFSTRIGRIDIIPCSRQKSFSLLLKIGVDVAIMISVVLCSASTEPVRYFYKEVLNR